MDHALIEQARPALERAAPIQLETTIRNTHRSVGAMLSGEVARRYGYRGLPDDTIHVRLQMTRFDALRLQHLIACHQPFTGSRHAGYILDHWTETLPKFVKVMPVQYCCARQEMPRAKTVKRPEISLTMGD